MIVVEKLTSFRRQLVIAQTLCIIATKHTLPSALNIEKLNQVSASCDGFSNKTEVVLCFDFRKSVVRANYF